jgi:hypothetical protein
MNVAGGQKVRKRKKTTKEVAATLLQTNNGREICFIFKYIC